MIIWIAPILLWLSGKAQDYVDFLRSVPSLIAPKPTGLSSPYTPPFTGGQCPDIGYSFSYEWRQLAPDGSVANNWTLSLGQGVGAIGQAKAVNYDLFSSSNRTGVGVMQFFYNHRVNNDKALTLHGFQLAGYTLEIRSFQITGRLDGGIDNCGNISNPSLPPSIPDDGLFNPTNPLIADENGTVNPAAIVLAPAFPLVLVTAILAGYQAAMQAAQAALAALDAIRKIAEGLEALKDLWEKLREFLNEWEKNRPKKRDTVRQTYGQLIGDGALDFFPSNNQKYQSIQLDIVITTIPIGFGKYFGSFSPHRYRYKELGYIAFYSSTQGVLEVRSLEFKRTSLQIPKLAVGFIYHLGLNDQIKGYAFGTFSVEKS